MPAAAPNPTFSALKGARLLRGVAPECVESLARAAHAQTFLEGERLWRAGDSARAFTIIQRGLVQIERTAGKEPAVLGIFGPRESVGDAAVLGRTVYPADALAASEEVQVVRIPSELVFRAMEQEPSLARAVQQVLVDHSQALTAKIDIVSAGTVGARLATLLLHLSERFGDEQDDGSVRVPIGLSRASLARLVSARVETVIRSLSSMRRAGWLRDESDAIVLLDPEALRRAART